MTDKVRQRILEFDMLLHQTAFELGLSDQLIELAKGIAHEYITMYPTTRVNTLCAALILLLGRKTSDIIPRKVITLHLNTSEQSINQTLNRIQKEIDLNTNNED